MRFDEDSDYLLSILNMYLEEGGLSDIDLAMRLRVIRDQLDRRKQIPGFHIYYWHTSNSQFSSNRLGFRKFEFLKTQRFGDAINRFVSCCRLTDNLCKYIIRRALKSPETTGVFVLTNRSCTHL